MSDGISDFPAYQPAGPAAAPGALICPKCGGVMRTYERNGIHLEQCQGCRGVYLDFGELEHLTQLEARMSAPPAAPPSVAYGYDTPSWGHHGGYRYRKGGLSSLFFSS